MVIAAIGPIKNLNGIVSTWGCGLRLNQHPISVASVSSVECMRTMEVNMAARSAEWEEGKVAKQSGAPYTADPYRAGSQESADWLAGYTHDEREQNVDSPEPGEG